MDINQEAILEHKYEGITVYIDSKFLAETPYTVQQIVGVIKRFCNKEGAVKPKTFIEMESFVNDLADFWIDANPEVHVDGERLLHAALSNYIAGNVWKAKQKSSNIVSSDLVGRVGKMLIYKNTLGAAVRLVNSRLNRDSCPNKELYQDFKTILPEAFYIMLPIISGLQTGKLKLPKGQKEKDLTRLIGGFFAQDPAVIGAAESLKRVGFKEKESVKAITKSKHEHEVA